MTINYAAEWRVTTTFVIKLQSLYCIKGLLALVESGSHSASTSKMMVHAALPA